MILELFPDPSIADTVSKFIPSWDFSIVKKSLLRSVAVDHITLTCPLLFMTASKLNSSIGKGDVEAFTDPIKNVFDEAVNQLQDF